jgi:Protein of unknown function (DUF3307)
LSKEKDNAYKEAFLYKALDDGQNTIRFTDTKAAAVIAFWTFFIATFISMKGIWFKYIVELKSWTELIFVILLILLMIAYLIRSVILAYTALVPRSNPGAHIMSEDIQSKGLFYLYGYNLPVPLEPKYLYKNHKDLKLGKKTKEYIKEFKEITEEEVNNEIILELQKISFIRNLKIDRVNESISLIMKFMMTFGVGLFYFNVSNLIDIEGVSKLWDLNFNIEVFIILYIAHKIADYLFQTDNQALNKTKKWTPLLTHCAIYTIILTLLPYLITGFISWLAIVVIFTSHVVIDNGEFLKFWARKVKRMDDPEAPNVKLAMFELDQAFHYIIIFFVSFI